MTFASWYQRNLVSSYGNERRVSLSRHPFQAMDNVQIDVCLYSLSETHTEREATTSTGRNPFVRMAIRSEGATSSTYFSYDGHLWVRHDIPGVPKACFVKILAHGNFDTVVVQ
jgi:hypothetical protein